MTSLNITREEAKILHEALGEYTLRHWKALESTLEKELQLRGESLAKLSQCKNMIDKASPYFSDIRLTPELKQKIAELGATLGHGPVSTTTEAMKTTFTIEAEVLPFLKRCYLFWRRENVKRLQLRKTHATDIEFIRRIDEQIKQADILETNQAFQAIGRNRSPAR